MPPVAEISEREMEMAPGENEDAEVIFVGDEDLNEEALAYIDSTLRDDETPAPLRFSRRWL